MEHVGRTRCRAVPSPRTRATTRARTDVRMTANARRNAPRAAHASTRDDRYQRADDAVTTNPISASHSERGRDALCWLRRGSRRHCHGATQACHGPSSRANESREKRAFRCSVVPPCATARTPRKRDELAAFNSRQRSDDPLIDRAPLQYQSRFRTSTPVPWSFASSSSRFEPR